MKKFLLLAAALFMVVSAHTQTPEQKKASVDRCVKLTKAKAPAICGLESIDILADRAFIAAVNTATITNVLEKLAARANGLNENGVADSKIPMPTLNECTGVSDKIKEQATEVKIVSELVPIAVAQLKSSTTMQKIKSTRPLAFSKDMLVIIGEETVYQGKTIAAIMELVKAAKK